MLMDWLYDLTPMHAGMILAGAIALAFLKLAIGERSRSLYRR